MLKNNPRSFTFTEPYDKRSYILLLTRLLKIHRHMGLTTDQLVISINNTLIRADMEQIIQDVKKDLYEHIFRQMRFYYSERMNKWGCMIEFAFGDSVEGISDTPVSALLKAESRLHDYLITHNKRFLSGQGEIKHPRPLSKLTKVNHA
jgi:2-hydroxy-3-keto-5-methylthiopentenyl-1-phosphate phosphatase